MQQPTGVTRRWSRPLVTLVVLGIAMVPAACEQAAPPVVVNCAADNAGLTLPPGFCASIYADSLGGIRHMAVASNGDVLIIRQNRPRGDSSGGGVFVLRDSDNDGHAEVVSSFGPVGGTGIALDGEFLYVDARTSILRYRYTAGDSAPVGAPDTLVKNIPTGGHAARNFVLDGQGSLYVNIGSQTNSCQVEDRQPASMGIDPCVELETRAGIWKFSSTQLGQSFTAGARFATGIRNAVGLAWHPTESALYATQHGRDNLFQNFPSLYDESASANQPAEELIKVTTNDDFGWPYCYYDTNLKRRVMAPEYGGNAQDIGRCADKKSPLVAFPGHWAPNGLLFYTGNTFPARYRDGAFIAFHGSWNRAPLPQAGYTVVFVPATKGAFGSEYETFADNFANGKLDPSTAEHRPTGLVTMNDGALLITDDRGGRVYRVQYQGTP